MVIGRTLVGGVRDAPAGPGRMCVSEKRQGMRTRETIHRLVDQFPDEQAEAARTWLEDPGNAFGASLDPYERGGGMRPTRSLPATEPEGPENS